MDGGESLEMCEQALNSGQMGEGSDRDRKFAASLFSMTLLGIKGQMSWYFKTLSNTYCENTVLALAELLRHSTAPLRK